MIGPRRLLSRLLYSEAALGTSAGYRLALRRRHQADGPRGRPHAPWRNAVLKTRREWEDATAQVNALGLHSHPTPSKNWDSLAALACTLERTGPEARILDAGAEVFSVILPWLFLYGYRNLVGINLAFDRPVRRGPIRYERGDLTRSRFDAGSFDAIICQSVVEHGVDVPAYLAEMARLLRPGGVLMTSVDYFSEPTATGGCRPYGMDYRVFSQPDIVDLLATARRVGLVPCDPIDLSCEERAIRWDTYGLEYTFLMLTLQKTEAGKAV
jgi:SAM-dependent methyltransferase